MTGHELISSDGIQRHIYAIRGMQVMLDRDLAELYGVETKALNQAVKRNIHRFPHEFMFQLSKIEVEYWKSQIVTSNREKMGLRKSPYAFTEQGVAMLSSVLRSDTAVKISVKIMNAFVFMRRFIASNAMHTTPRLFSSFAPAITCFSPDTTGYFSSLRRGFGQNSSPALLNYPGVK